MRLTTTLRGLGVALTLILIGASAYAAEEVATSVADGECVAFTFCVDQTATGACVSGADELYAQNSHATARIDIEAFGSTATTFTCHLYASATGAGYEAAARQALTSTGVTQSQLKISVKDVGPGDLFVECPTITGGNVDIVLKRCPQ